MRNQKKGKAWSLQELLAIDQISSSGKGINTKKIESVILE